MVSSDSVWNTRTHPSSPVSDLAIARAGSPSNVNLQMSLGFSGIDGFSDLAMQEQSDLMM